MRVTRPIVALCAPLMLVNCDADPPTDPVVPDRPIAFVSNRDGVYRVYTVEPDGTGAVPLTAGDGQHPAWSPDGSRIAYVSHQAGNAEIYVMNADGTDPVRLTHHPASDGHPAWSPDGSRIAFVSERDDPGGRSLPIVEVYVMNADGTAQVRITHDEFPDMQPAWSPDGEQIAFASLRSGNIDVYKMNADGTGQVRLTSDVGADVSPRWSPDGRRIAFASHQDGTQGVYVMTSEGTNALRLTDASSSWGPSWSHDGKMIVFARHVGEGNADLFMMSATGSHLAQITTEAGWDTEPAWSP